MGFPLWVTRRIIESTECLKESTYFLEHGVFPDSSSLSETNAQEEETEQAETSEEEQIEEEEDDNSE